MNPYEILGVSPNASKESIKAAWIKLVKQYHPDRNPGNKAAEEKLKRINQAYDMVKEGNYEHTYNTNNKTQQTNRAPRHFEVNINYNDQRNGFFRYVDKALIRFPPGAYNGSVYTTPNGDKVYPVFHLPDGFNIKDGLLHTVVEITKKEAKRGITFVPVPDGWVVTRKLKFNAKSSIEHNSKWDIFGVGFYNKDTKRYDPMLVTFKIKKFRLKDLFK